jgi:pilus assembly protein CpaF
MQPSNDIGTATGCWDLVAYYLAPIRHLFDLPGVTEIEINRFDRIFVEQNGVTRPVPGAAFADDESVTRLVYQIANALGQPVDSSTHPVLDARLQDDTRVCAVLYPVSPQGTCITFRVFPKQHITAAYLIENSSMTTGMLDFLKTAVTCRANILVSGGTGSGKTTLLNALSEFIPQSDRILTVEDTRELRIVSDNHVPMEAPARRGHTDGQKIDLAFLIKTTLRMKPTRIIVGEIRDGQAATAFLHAVNTGHSACSTIHANGPRDALIRIQTLVAGQGDLPFDVVRAQVRANLDLVVHTECTPNHGRKVISITEIHDGRQLELWRWSYRQARHVQLPQKSCLYKRLDKYAKELAN